MVTGTSFGNSRVFLGSKWLELEIIFMSIIVLASVTSEHEMGTPSTELLCISDCATCPVICAPPPPPLLKSISPPSSSVYLSPPPEPYYTPRSPSESDDTRCPPSLESESLPPPPRRPPPPPPAQPSSYSSKASPPPPRFVYFFNAPPGQGLPTGLEPHGYPYPYFYYPSKASHLSFQASLLLVVLFCFIVVL